MNILLKILIGFLLSTSTVMASMSKNVKVTAQIVSYDQSSANVMIMRKMLKVARTKIHTKQKLKPQMVVPVTISFEQFKGLYKN